MTHPLKEYLVKEHISIRQFAKDIKISRQAVYNILGAVSFPSLKTIEKIVMRTEKELTPAILIEAYHKIKEEKKCI